jgi:hypothetical protein
MQGQEIKHCLGKILQNPIPASRDKKDKKKPPYRETISIRGPIC